MNNTLQSNKISIGLLLFAKLLDQMSRKTKSYFEELWANVHWAVRWLGKNHFETWLMYHFTVMSFSGGEFGRPGNLKFFNIFEVLFKSVKDILWLRKLYT